jgi:hypothetical protein
MKKEYKPGDKAFFNNGLIEILEDKGHEFYLVKGFVSNITDEISGRSFCTQCNIGGTSAHTCEEAQEIIDIVLEEVQDERVFFVHEKYLYDAPFEYVTYKKLKKEIAALREEKKQLNNDPDIEAVRKIRLEREVLLEDKRRLEEEKNKLNTIIVNLYKDRKTIKLEIEEAEKARAKILGTKQINKPDGSRFEKLELK